MRVRWIEQVSVRIGSVNNGTRNPELVSFTTRLIDRSFPWYSLATIKTEINQRVEQWSVLPLSSSSFSFSIVVVMLLLGMAMIVITTMMIVLGRCLVYPIISLSSSVRVFLLLPAYVSMIAVVVASLSSSSSSSSELAMQMIALLYSTTRILSSLVNQYVPYVHRSHLSVVVSW